MRTRKLATAAMLAAMCAVLGYLAIDTGSLKVTFESLPVLLGAMLLGPVDGFAVGLVGTAIYQLARYGISATTPLWIMPYAIAGAFVGYAAKKKNFALSQKKTTVLVVSAELFITLFNTLTIYIDSKLFGYYFAGLIAGSLALRLVLCIGKAAVFSAVLPQLLRVLRERGHFA